MRKTRRKKFSGKFLLKTISRFNKLPKKELKRLVGPMKKEYTYEQIINEVNNFTELSKDELKKKI
jgi:hypothetical protein